MGKLMKYMVLSATEDIPTISEVVMTEALQVGGGLALFSTAFVLLIYTEIKLLSR